MKDGYEKDWHILCCSDNSGACDGCGPRTLAYVLAGGGRTSSDGGRTW